MIIKYFAEDGTEFDNEEECLSYEEKQNIPCQFNDNKTKVFSMQLLQYEQISLEQIRKIGFGKIDALIVYDYQDMKTLYNLSKDYSPLPWREMNSDNYEDYAGHWAYNFSEGSWEHFEECSEIFDRLRLFSYFPDLPNFSKIFHELGV